MADTLTTERPWSVAVKNFGPIAEALVDIRPLTVFVGPSNTGKSYLATLVYALHQSLAPRGPWRHHRLGRGIVSPRSSKNRAAALRGLRNWMAHVLGDDAPPVLPSDVADLIRAHIEQPPGLDRAIESVMRRCFGVETLGELTRRPRSRISHVDLLVPQKRGPQTFRYGIRLRKEGVQLTCKYDVDDEVLSEMVWSDKRFSRQVIQRMPFGDYDSFEQTGDGAWWFLLHQMNETVQRSLLYPFEHPAYYLPADRTGVMHSHKVVVSALIQNAATAGLRPSADVPALSGVLADFLDQLIQMVERRPARRATKASEALAKRMEASVLKGGVHVKRTQTNYPEFVYRPEGWQRDIPLMRSSSMVSELAPVVLYLRHVVRPGDVVIIEEPESHLHPAMQVEVIRCLAEVVHHGIRVIVTTHSEWVLDALANIVQASQVSNEERKGLAGAEVALHPAQVGAWLFRPREMSDGVVVREIKIGESGLYPSGFDGVAMKLHNAWARLGERGEQA